MPTHIIVTFTLLTHIIVIFLHRILHPSGSHATVCSHFSHTYTPFQQKTPQTAIGELWSPLLKCWWCWDGRHNPQGLQWTSNIDCQADQQHRYWEDAAEELSKCNNSHWHIYQRHAVTCTDRLDKNLQVYFGKHGPLLLKCFYKSKPEHVLTSQPLSGAHCH